MYVVRKILESDIDGYRSALASVVSERKYLLTAQTPSLEDTTKFIHDNIAKNIAQYVALAGDEIIGWADIIPYEKELIRHSGLLGMGVVADHRGKGVGKELLVRTISHARQTGLERIELEVFANNAVAVGLYEQLGFVHEGTKRSARYVNGYYEDVFIMSQCYM